MYRHVSWLIGAVLVASPGAAGCAGAADPSRPLVIRLGHVGAPGSHYDQAAQRFEALVEARLPGRIDVRVFPASQLGEDREMLEGLRLGTLEMHAPSSVLHGTEPLLELFDLPFLIESREQVERIVEGPIGERIRAALLERGLVLLGFWENGFRVITSNVRPVVTPADLRGVKIRTPRDPGRVRLFERLGASPASMPFSELFTALRQGVVDAQENPLSQIVSARLYEVQRYLAVSRHLYSPGYAIMRRAFFESLPPEVRRVLRDSAVEIGRLHRTAGAEQEGRDLEVCRGHLQINDIDRDAFVAATRPMYDDFTARFGRELLDTVERASGDDGSAR